MKTESSTGSHTLGKNLLVQTKKTSFSLSDLRNSERNNSDNVRVITWSGGHWLHSSRAISISHSFSYILFCSGGTLNLFNKKLVVNKSLNWLITIILFQRYNFRLPLSGLLVFLIPVRSFHLVFEMKPQTKLWCNVIRCFCKIHWSCTLLFIYMLFSSL